jgi:hypothetical protein
MADDGPLINCHSALVTRRRARRHMHRASPQAEGPSSPVTVVSWEMDYGFRLPLVDASPGAGVVPLGKRPVPIVERLGIPPDLGQRMAEWAHRWEDLAMRQVWGEPPTEWAAHADRDLARDERALIDDLRRTLAPDVELLVWGRPFTEWRERQRRPGG